MGPLHGFKIVEIAGIGPTQLCGMLLADMGATVIRIENPTGGDLGIDMDADHKLLNRSRSTILVDLKTEQGAGLVLRLCEDADAIFEGFRPGVMEKLGLGPTQCRARNERLVYGRMTGFGQDGPLANMAGHDANYIALAGALHSIGDKDRPPPLPLNLIGDFGGGGLYLAMGLLAAMLECGKSGKGQVVDCAMVDGVANMLTMFYGFMSAGAWRDQRQSNFLDGGAPYARVYETADGKYVAVCAIERRFYRALLEGLGIDDIDPAEQHRSDGWPDHEARFAAAFKSRTRDEWAGVFEGTDACATPVLSMTEAPEHPHSRARGSYIEVEGVLQPGPAPRFSRTPSAIRHGPQEDTANFRQILTDWGLGEEDIQAYI
jgi:alpha-methylacyl-CoA racemase